jgi:hypothetical protein
VLSEPPQSTRSYQGLSHPHPDYLLKLELGVWTSSTVEPVAAIDPARKHPAGVNVSGDGCVKVPRDMWG